MRRVRVIKPGLRETGSTGSATVIDGDWFVVLDRSEPPFRGVYQRGEVEFIDSTAEQQNPTDAAP